MKSRIHVNQHVIKANRVNKENNPVLSIMTYRSTVRAHEIRIVGPSKIVHSPDKPLSCGARVWIETEALVEVVR